MRIRTYSIILILCALFLSPTAGAQTLRVTPQWLPQAQFAGLYIADSLGFYKQAGVDVEISHPSATRSSYQMLKDNETDVITSQFTDALILWNDGFKLVNVLQCNENNSLMIVSHDTITKPQDLKGKKIAHWKAGFSDLGFIFDTQHALNADWIPIHSNIAIYISGAVDATLVMEYNEYFQLLMSGTPLSRKQVFYLRDFNLNIQEDGFYVTPRFLAKNRDKIERFVEATKKGWEWARKQENQDKALDIVMDAIAKHNVHSNKVNQAYMLKTILKLQENEQGIAPYKITEERFNEAVDLLLENGYIKDAIPYKEFVLNF